ncbi:MAG: ABC transporter permease [Streptosporangiales bacterium]
MIIKVLQAYQPQIISDLLQHLYLAFVPIVLGLVIAIPLGMLAARTRWANAPLLGASSVAYAIPSLALFIVLPSILGTKILSPTNVIVALTLYAVALLFRSVKDGLQSVPEPVRQASTAMGMKRARQLFTVEFPIAIPVIAAGLRVVAVTTISMVSVGALIGIGGLGGLFTTGFQISSYVLIVTGIVLSVLLALLTDVAIVLVQRATTPWTRLASR